jgi:hypothetical protein
MAVNSMRPGFQRIDDNCWGSCHFSQPLRSGAIGNRIGLVSPGPWNPRLDARTKTFIHKVAPGSRIFLRCLLQPYETRRFVFLTLKGNNMQANQQSTSNEEIEKKAGKPVPAQEDAKETPAGGANDASERPAHRSFILKRSTGRNSRRN